MGTLKAPPSGVTVRMYRQGLGDCFLLAFPTGDPKKPFYMMIDCGVVLGTDNAPAKMTDVVQDIRGATGGEIDLLVITHEHWDHVSGFLQADAALQGFQVKGLWFAWTEDPADELGKKLREEFKKDLNALHMALNRAVDKQAMTPVASVLEFFGDAPVPGASPAKNTTGAAFQAVRDLAGRGGTKAEYRRPGEGPLPLPGVSGARVYVLGPPHDERLLRRINPTARGKEVYTEGLTARKAFLMAANDRANLSHADLELLELSFPFDSRLRIAPKDAKGDPFFRKHYGFQKKGTDAWRRIDDDWLGTAGELALQLDSYTNNTSLALAIELIPSGKVLLFVADAQVGNWLSWDALTWSVPAGKGKPPTTVGVGDLLARTVLYKVGHHGSHNATIRGEGAVQKGLELMNHPELVAMIPVDHDMAVKKRWGKMPFDPLLKRLNEKAKYRVLRVDQPIPKKGDPPPAGVSKEDWDAFRGRVGETTLYMEYTIGEP